MTSSPKARRIIAALLSVYTLLLILILIASSNSTTTGTVTATADVSTNDTAIENNVRFDDINGSSLSNSDNNNNNLYGDSKDDDEKHIIDERTWLDVFADEAKTFLTNDLARYWNELHRQCKNVILRRRSRFFRRLQDEEEQQQQNHHDHRYGDPNHHHRSGGDGGDHRFDYFVKKLAMRVAMSTSSSCKRFGQWSRPVTDRFRRQSLKWKQKTSQHSQRILHSIEDRLHFVSDKLGHSICDDLRQRCQQQQFKRNNNIEDDSNSPTEKEGLEELEAIQFAWQERLLCYRSVIVEDCSS
jgi:hypothetical protein